MADKQQLTKDAALVALKRQAEWHDMPPPSAEQIHLRLSQVQQYKATESTDIAMRDIVLQHLSMRLQIRQLQDDLTSRALWSRVKRLFRRSV
jgi:hypothetical protein